MRRIIRNPFLGFPLSVALAMALGAAWSLTRDDRLVINQIFLVILAMIPLSGAGLFNLHRQGTRGPVAASAHLDWDGCLGEYCGFWRVFCLRGSDSLQLDASLQLPSLSLCALCARRDESARVRAGDQAVEETLYTLEGKSVSLTGLWQERPIVVEFGSFT